MRAELAGAPTLFIHKKPEKAVLPPLEPGQGAIVMAFRRNGGDAAGRSGLVQLFRYDRTKGDLVYQPRDWKKTGDKTSYVVSIPSGDKKAAYELRVIPVTAGDYVLNGATVGMTTPPTFSNCFGAPMIRVEAGQYAYLGDASPIMGARLATGAKTSAMIFTRHFDKARDAMTKLASRHRRQDGRTGDLQPRDLFLRGGDDGPVRLAGHGRPAEAGRTRRELDEQPHRLRVAV